MLLTCSAMYKAEANEIIPTITMKYEHCTTSIYLTQKTKEIKPPISAYIANALKIAANRTIMFFMLWI